MTEATVVIVNYRSGDALGGCLDSLMEDPPARVVVIDNASGDDSAAPARQWSERDGRVELVELESNLGLAGGVDHVLPSITTPYLIPLNPDTVTHPGWWRRLIEHLESSPHTAVACPLIMMMGTDRINSLGQHVHVTGLGFNRLLGSPADRAPTDTHPVPGLHGTAFAIRTEVLQAIGGWDATGFLYHEDVALSWSVRLAGWEIEAVPAAVVEHDYQLSMSPDKLFLLERNRWAMLLSHLRPWTRVALAPVLLVSETAIWALCLRRGPAFLKAKTRSYRWVLENRDAIRSWRERVAGFRRVGDHRLLATQRWSYPLGQGVTLAAEKGPSTRVPPGGLPTGPGA